MNKYTTRLLCHRRDSNPRPSDPFLQLSWPLSEVISWPLSSCQYPGEPLLGAVCLHDMCQSFPRACARLCVQLHATKAALEKDYFVRCFERKIFGCHVSGIRPTNFRIVFHLQATNLQNFNLLSGQHTKLY